jgi:uncharacterized protein YggE
MNFKCLVCFAVGLALSLPVNAQTFAGRPFLSVKGHAKARVKPDLFPIELTIVELGMDPGRSQRTVEDLSRVALEAAQKQGLPDVDIEVGNLSISPQTEWNDKTEEDVFQGNEYERKLRFRFHDLDKLRAFIEAIPESRNVHLRTLEFEFSGQQELERSLRRKAIEDARRGAGDMADAVGKRLVELFNVSDRAQNTVYSASGYQSPSFGLESVTVAGSSAALLAPGTVKRNSQIVLREGEIEVSADAFLVYVIGD